jgi:hypothetical protein
MSNTAFSQVTFPLGKLVNDIDMGQIGLPDIQRPFVWPNTKVRDLFDSMYRGFPVGYLLFWENGLVSGHRAIGSDAKQLTPSLVIVDGQQRLTSLFAVIKGATVIRSNYRSERIRIAFNPMEEMFEVTSAATERDRSFIPDISQLWSDETDLFQVANDYLSGLRSARDVSDQEVKSIQAAITKLQGLVGFPFTALQLSAETSEEAVAEVFVRINSQGKPLNQADFILTLMSVFWDAGRMELEDFCRGARASTTGEPSPRNHFIEPSPDQMLRVGVGLAFKRARLEHVYSILRGKDLETGEFSEERRDDQFERLRDAQSKVLNLQNWHDFMHCLRKAGYRSRRMVSSQTALLYSYTLYLIGKTELRMEEHALRQVIAQWFFMSAVTGRYTGSPESRMESDLAMLRGVSSADEFAAKLRQTCNVTLTTDFWEVTLPNELATSSARSPSLFAFEAALVLLDAPVLFSDSSVSEMLGPAWQDGQRNIERHHLFPRGHLAQIGITATRDVNQIANYAYVEWTDNARISAQSPEEYLQPMRKRFSEAALAHMYRRHGLPDGWESMDYWAFLARRRELIAQIVREGYKRLTTLVSAEENNEAIKLDSVIASGESDLVEFKSTLRVNLHTGKRDSRIELSALKTLAGFLNKSGGTLLIGVADDGSPLGLKDDGFPNEDRMGLHLASIVNERMGASVWAYMHANFDDFEEGRVLVVRCEASRAPVYVKDGNVERFFVRTGPSTTELPLKMALEYIGQRFK